MSETTPPESPLLTSRMVVVFTGFAFLFIAISFAYLDRSYIPLGPWSIVWGVWGFLGFSVGIYGIGREPSRARQVWWGTLAFIGLTLGFFVVFSALNLLRLTSALLMILIAARAAVMRTDRDFYLTMVVLVAVSFMICTHLQADWTIWFYMGPAWIAIALAFAWHHASGVKIKGWIKALQTAVFILVSVLIASLLFLFLPRPPLLGFGFLPPGTMETGLLKNQGGAGEQQQSQSGLDPNQGGASGSLQGTGEPNGQMGTLKSGERGQQWQMMLDQMRQQLGGRGIPNWQKSVMEQLLDWGQSILDEFRGSPSSDPGDQKPHRGNKQPDSSSLQKQGFQFGIPPPALPNDAANLWWYIPLLLFAAIAWMRRWRWGQSACLSLAWMCAKRQPHQSMRLSALAMKWCLHEKGHLRAAGQSVREHWISAPRMAPLAHKWMEYAVHLYCAMRFGNVRVDSQMAMRMRTAVLGATDILHGKMKELKN